MDRTRKRLIKKINEKVNDIEISDKIVILNEIAFKYTQEVIFEEGTGTRVLFDQIDDMLLKKIWDIIEEGLIKTRIPHLLEI